MEKKEQSKEEVKKAIKEVKDENERVKLVALNHLMAQKMELDDQMNKEMRVVEAKYQVTSDKVLMQQQQIIEGRALTSEELEKLEDFVLEGEVADYSSHSKIEGYWAKACKNQEVVGAEITSKDEEVLKALTKVEFKTEFDEESGKETLTVMMTFGENDFFPAGVLTKSVVQIADEQRPIKSEGTEIQWKEGKDLTKKTVQKKQKNKKSGQSRVVTKTVEDESFFNFFKSGDASEEALAEIDDEEEQDQIQERMEIDYDIINSLVEEVIPYSLEYYLDLEAGDFEDEEEELDAVDEEEEESDEGTKKSKKSKKNKKSSRKGSKDGEQQQQECKQQ